MKSNELREKFLKYFEKQGHKIIPSASLTPSENVELAGTQRVLFTTAGMHPLVPYLLGELHPFGQRLTNVQKCLRTDDIEEVGDNIHNTFFEMLGNWSLGDPKSSDGIGQEGYWKDEAISWSYQFLTTELGLDTKRLYVSVFAGDKDAPFDNESYQIWRKLGIPDSHIFKYGKKDNWWGPVGDTGPCGPDTEMFYDVVDDYLGNQQPANNSERFVEIWNDVFMEYDKQSDGSFESLRQKNVDTGMGLERILAVLNDKKSIFETDLFVPIIETIKKLSKEFNIKSARIIADHLRASVFLLSDGVKPSNLERGYVLRRLIRRAIRHAAVLKIDGKFLGIIAKSVIETYGSFYKELVSSEEQVLTDLENEETRFKNALTLGFNKLHKISGNISAKDAFDLYQNFGFPIELTTELAHEDHKIVDVDGFEKLLEKHQQLSRTAATTGKFRGGLANQGQLTTFGHTATHLLHQALRDVLGSHICQTGSNITSKRIRFDFSHDKALTSEQTGQVEKIVNQKIKGDLPIEKKLMTQDEADKLGAIGLFKEKYGNKVSIYKIGDYSIEYCGGPHARSTGSLESFKIIKEQSVGVGLRRIYAQIIKE